MKKIVLLFTVIITLISCEENISKNEIAMQGRINNAFWKSVNVTAIKDVDGTLKLTGYNGFDQLELNLSSFNVGTYRLGTNNLNNSALYTSLNDKKEYETIVYPSPVNQIKLVNAGTGYLEATSIPTSGGSGTGLRVNIKANLTTGAITEVLVNAPGTGYKSGDLVNITTGNSDATFEVLNVTKSNGEIVITENKGGVITGTFKLTAVEELTGKTIIFRDGIFYKVPVK